MPQPTFTPEQLAALNAAIAQGVRKVKYGDKEVEYRDLDEMLQLAGVMENQINNAGRSRRYYAQHNSGK
jgi:hypothetical protein